MIDLDLIKKHCLISSNDFDDLLQQYQRSAFELVATHTSRQWYATQEELDQARATGQDNGTGMVYTDGVDTAMLMLISGWFENRESISQNEMKELPFGVWALIQPYRIYGL